MHNHFYKFLESFRQFNPTLVEAIGIGFGAIYEVFDRGGELEYMGDEVVKATLSDGTTFNVDLDDFITTFTTAEGNSIEVSAYDEGRGVLSVNFRRLTDGYYSYEEPTGERDPVMMEGVIAVIRAFAEYMPSIKEIKFYGVEDIKDIRAKRHRFENIQSLIYNLIQTLPKDSRDQVKADIMSTLTQNIPSNINKALLDTYDIVNNSINNVDEADKEQYEDALRQPYVDLTNAIRNEVDLNEKGNTRRDRAYILMIKRRDRNADISFDGKYYHYKLSPELMEKKANNPDL